MLDMFLQLFLVEARAQVHSGSDDRSPAMLGEYDALAIKFEISALDRDHADTQFNRELADGRNLLPRLPVADHDALLDLFHDLQVHRPAVCLRDDDATVHIDRLSI